MSSCHIKPTWLRWYTAYAERLRQRRAKHDESRLVDRIVISDEKELRRKRQLNSQELVALKKAHPGLFLRRGTAFLSCRMNIPCILIVR